MIQADYHVHTTWCDGKSSARETVISAIEKGVSVLGFSGHGYTPCGTDYCMSPEGEISYREEIVLLNREYGDKIKILCGVERDYCGNEAPWADFVIGSVHHMKINGEIVNVDESPEKLLLAAEKHFGGDMYSVCEAYFETVSDVADKINPHIIGHFDLITKFNEKRKLFDEENPRYISAWKSAADRLLTHKIPFEINTGAISRGYRSAPYPSESQIKYISAGGGSFLLTSDCHDAGNLCFEFSKWREWAERLGAKIIEKI